MNADVVKLCRALGPLMDLYDEWELPLRQFRAQNYRRLNRGGYTWEAYESGLAQLEAQLVAIHNPRLELHALFDRLCDAFIDSGAEERTAIRTFVADRRKLGQLLWRYANRLTQCIAGLEDAPKATRALAAIAIDDCSANYRDTLMTLADLYVAVESAGIDPRASFAAAAHWATDALTAGGCESLAVTMREFHGSSVLRERRSLGQPYGGPA